MQADNGGARGGEEEDWCLGRMQEKDSGCDAATVDRYVRRPSSSQRGDFSKTFALIKGVCC